MRMSAFVPGPAAVLALAILAAPIAPAALQAQELSIADAHFHVIPKAIGADELRRLMDELGIKWAGGAGSFAPERALLDYHRVLGNRLQLFGGQKETVDIFLAHGAAVLENAESAPARELLAALDRDLGAGRIKGIGEIHVNASTTGPPHRRGLRRKTRADAPTHLAMFALAAKHGVPMMIHAQWDSDTVEQLHVLARSQPSATLVLGHCGAIAKAAAMGEFLARNPNAMCDLSHMNRPQYQGNDPLRVIVFTSRGLEEDWRELIERMPDRFMVGIDDVYSAEMYRDVVEAIRKGLLAKLTPETARKVAHANADRLFKMN